MVESIEVIYCSVNTLFRKEWLGTKEKNLILRFGSFDLRQFYKGAADFPAGCNLQCGQPPLGQKCSQGEETTDKRPELLCLDFPSYLFTRCTSTTFCRISGKCNILLLTFVRFSKTYKESTF